MRCGETVSPGKEGGEPPPCGGLPHPHFVGAPKPPVEEPEKSAGVPEPALQEGFPP